MRPALPVIARLGVGLWLPCYRQRSDTGGSRWDTVQAAVAQDIRHKGEGQKRQPEDGEAGSFSQMPGRYR